MSNLPSLLWWKVCENLRFERWCDEVIRSTYRDTAIIETNICRQGQPRALVRGSPSNQPLSGCSALVRRDTTASFWKCLWVVGGRLSALQFQVVSGELHTSWESILAGPIAPRGTTLILCQLSQACSSLSLGLWTWYLRRRLRSCIRPLILCCRGTIGVPLSGLPSGIQVTRVLPSLVNAAVGSDPCNFLLAEPF